MSTTIQLVSRVFGFVERRFAETEQKRANLGYVKEKSQTPEEGSAPEDILKQDFGQLNEDRLYRNMDRLYGKRAPIGVALCVRKGRNALLAQVAHPAFAI